MINEIDKKTILGQFFTIEYKKILQNLYIPENTIKIIEPFAGNGDLLNFIDDKNICIECYDIDPKHEYIIKQNTLLNPPVFKNSFILTNPPYLGRNKSKDKTLFNKYNVNDLYKCFIKTILEDKPDGGIIILPINFWCSIRKMDIELRSKFLKEFSIIRLNIFEEPVFKDTTSTICSFQFKLGSSNKSFPLDIYPSKKYIEVILNQNNNFTIGGEIYNLVNNTKYIIGRLFKNTKPSTQIVAKCIDDSINNKICLSFVDIDDIYYDNTINKSARTYATLTIHPKISHDRQKKLVYDFNKFINQKREDYHSLFLTNFRESKISKNNKMEFARKRISFNLVYKIVAHLLND